MVKRKPLDVHMAVWLLDEPRSYSSLHRDPSSVRPDLASSGSMFYNVVWLSRSRNNRTISLRHDCFDWRWMARMPDGPPTPFPLVAIFLPFSSRFSSSFPRASRCFFFPRREPASARHSKRTGNGRMTDPRVEWEETLQCLFIGDRRWTVPSTRLNLAPIGIWKYRQELK